MLSIAKINAASNQSANGGRGYLQYLAEPSNRQRSDFDDYARGTRNPPALLSLDRHKITAYRFNIERLAIAEHVRLNDSFVDWSQHVEQKPSFNSPRYRRYRICCCGLLRQRCELPP